jgi:hypothetical protein
VRSVAKHPCKASFFAGVFFCLVPALARARFDVLPDIVQDRLPAVALLLRGMGLLGVEAHHDIDAVRHVGKGDVDNAVTECVIDPLVGNAIPSTCGSIYFLKISLIVSAHGAYENLA